MILSFWLILCNFFLKKSIDIFSPIKIIYNMSNYEDYDVINEGCGNYSDISNEEID